MDAVFSSRIRQAYVRRRSKREMAVATLLLMAVMGACGLAAREDERAQDVSAEVFNSELRRSIVATWAAPSPVVTYPRSGR